MAVKSLLNRKCMPKILSKYTVDYVLFSKGSMA
jgi:hypothetical protein